MGAICPITPFPPAASCWTLWAARWTSAPRTRPCTAASSTASDIPEQAILRDNASRVYFRVLRELTAACQREGSVSPLRDPEELVADLVALHRGMLFEWRIYEQGFDLVYRGRRMAAALLDGWRQPEN